MVFVFVVLQGKIHRKRKSGESGPPTCVAQAAGGRPLCCSILAPHPTEGRFQSNDGNSGRRSCVRRRARRIPGVNLEPFRGACRRQQVSGRIEIGIRRASSGCTFPNGCDGPLGRRASPPGGTAQVVSGLARAFGRPVVLKSLDFGQRGEPGKGPDASTPTVWLVRYVHRRPMRGDAPGRLGRRRSARSGRTLRSMDWVDYVKPCRLSVSEIGPTSSRIRLWASGSAAT